MLFNYKFMIHVLIWIQVIRIIDTCALIELINVIELYLWCMYKFNYVWCRPDPVPREQTRPCPTNLKWKHVLRVQYNFGVWIDTTRHGPWRWGGSLGCCSSWRCCYCGVNVCRAARGWSCPLWSGTSRCLWCGGGCSHRRCEYRGGASLELARGRCSLTFRRGLTRLPAGWGRLRFSGSAGLNDDSSSDAVTELLRFLLCCAGSRGYHLTAEDTPNTANISHTHLDWCERQPSDLLPLLFWDALMSKQVVGGQVNSGGEGQNGL